MPSGYAWRGEVIGHALEQSDHCQLVRSRAASPNVKGPELFSHPEGEYLLFVASAVWVRAGQGRAEQCQHMNQSWFSLSYGECRVTCNKSMP